jgi:phosphate:Na+ symporter
MRADVFSCNFRFPALLLLLGLTLFSVLAYAASTPQAADAAIDWLQLGMGLFGGLALFLAGLELLSEGLKKAAGQTLKDVLSKLTSNRFMGALTGAFVTGVLNSSSVTTVLVVGFVTAGVMSLAQSVGIIMGANIGSTVTAQLLAFNLSQYALLPVALGFFMLFAAKRERIKFYGMMIMGLGLVFFGMGIMSEAMNPLRSYEPFLDVLQRMEKPVLGILAGALFTALVQSSAATVGIAIAMASEGLLSLPAGIALALGANIGTCVTALMAALGKPTEAVRAATVHVLFNVLGVVVWLPLITLLADIAVLISPVSSDLQGSARAAAEVPRQIANANTLFNIINTLLFIGFTGWFARIAEKLTPEKPPEKGVIIEPKYLDTEILKAPSLALEAVRREIGRAGDVAMSMYQDMQSSMQTRSRESLQDIARRDDQVDILEASILEYLSKIRQGLLTEEESQSHQALMTAVVNLEGLADVIETDLVILADTYIENGYQTSDATRDILSKLYQHVGEAIALSVKAVRDNDQLAAEQLIHMKSDIVRLSEAFLSRKSESLGVEDAQYLAVARWQISMVDKLRRIYTIAKRMAKVALPAPLAGRD